MDPLNEAPTNQHPDSTTPTPPRAVPLGGAPAATRSSLPGCLGFIFLASAGLLVLLLLIVAGLSANGETWDTASSSGLPAGASKLREQYVIGSGDDRIALIDINGVIMSGGGGSPFMGATPDMVNAIRIRLVRAAADDTVKAVVLRIDSPGGGVTPSDQIWKLVTDFRKDTGKPVITSMGAVAASGGYYIAVATDYIVAENTTITGSIGVIMSGLNFSKLLERYDVLPVTLTSGPNKNLLGPYDPVQPEHRRILQDLVDEMYARFVEVVLAGRSSTGLDAANIAKLADGRVYTAKQALDNQLIDQIGYIEDAMAKARELASITEASVFTYDREPNLADILGIGAYLPGVVGSHSVLELKVDLEALQSLQTPTLMYVWAPGLDG